MNDLPSGKYSQDINDVKPQPWERQPGEPLDNYRWFQIYICIPPPRTFKRVNQLIAFKPGSKLVSRAANHWRWKERVAASDDPDTGASLALKIEWRDQLLRELDYISQFIALEDTARALQNASIGQLGQVEARKRLPALLQYQRGLHRLIEPQKRNEAISFEDREVKHLIFDRMMEIRHDLLEPILSEAYAKVNGEAEIGAVTESAGGFGRQPDSTSVASDSDMQAEQQNEEPGQRKIWRQWPAEPDAFLFQFRLYLSLSFLQSTAQVARMAKVRRKTTLDKVARKWRWQQRAAAFEAEHADQPSARAELQGQLLLDSACNAQLHGLIETDKALEAAQLGQLNCARARHAFSDLSRHQLSLLRSALRQNGTVAWKNKKERRGLRINAMVEKAAQKRAIDGLRKLGEDFARTYGPDDEIE